MAIEFENEEVKQEFLADYDVLLAQEAELVKLTAAYNEIKKSKESLEVSVADSTKKLSDKYEIKINPQGKIVGKRSKTIMTFSGDILRIGGESISL